MHSDNYTPNMNVFERPASDVKGSCPGAGGGGTQLLFWEVCAARTVELGVLGTAGIASEKGVLGTE